MGRTLTILAALILAGCAGIGERGSGDPTPRDVVGQGEASGDVHWGGQIVRTENLRDRTRIEVLALPLDSSGRPRAGADAEGRFIVEQPGFLEPHEYARGRLVEVRGRLRGFHEGRVGDAAYRYPLVSADTLELWPEHQEGFGGRTPRINIGVGAGSYGSGVGIGIGF